MRRGGFKKILGLLVGLAAFPLSAKCDGRYKFVVLYDENSLAQATQIVSFLKKSPPFSQMGNQIDFETVPVMADDMKCANSTPNSPRIISCDTKSLWNTAFQHGANRGIIVTSKGEGGSGGNPLIVGKDYPLTTVLHELTHSYGLGDEYEYSAAEASYYNCGNTKLHVRDHNLAWIKPEPPYSSDAQARTKHGKEIPWFGDISGSTLITTATDLGTAPKVFPPDEPALYAGGDCNKIIPTWKPLQDKTIMEDLSVTALPPLYQKWVVQAMSAEIGFPITLVPAGSQCTDCRAQ